MEAMQPPVRRVYLHDAIEIVRRAGDADPEKALLDRLRCGALRAFAERYLTVRCEPQPSDVEKHVELSRENNTLLAPGFWAEVVANFHFDVSWEESWATYTSPSLDGHPPGHGRFWYMRVASDIYVGRDELISEFPNRSNVKADLTTKERTTLLKLIICMAVDHYRYKPGAAQNSTARFIRHAQEKMGVKPTDEQTINKYLEEARNAGLHEKG
jgi:hypothetical protein